MVEEVWTGGWSAVEISGLGKSLKRVKDGGLLLALALTPPPAIKSLTLIASGNSSIHNVAAC